MCSSWTQKAIKRDVSNLDTWAPRRTDNADIEIRRSLPLLRAAHQGGPAFRDNYASQLASGGKRPVGGNERSQQ